MPSVTCPNGCLRAGWSPWRPPSALLGPPLLIRDEVVYATPRGRKVWALLAYLALSHGPPSRQQLDRPAVPGRRGSGGRLAVEPVGAPAAPRRPGHGRQRQRGAAPPARRARWSTSSCCMGGTSGEAVELPGLGRELLEGMDIEASPGFTAWLLGERRRLHGLSEAVLREGALRCARVGERPHGGGARHATRGGRSPERGRPRVARPRIRGYGGRRRGRTADLRVGRSVPS